MFLFTSNASGINVARVRSGRARNSFHVHKHDSAIAVWRSSPFTSAQESEDRLVLRLQRPDDPEPICVFEWRFKDGKLTITRRWSGEFSILAIEDPELLIFSHLRFALLVCNEVPSRAQSMPPGSIWTYSLTRRPYSPDRAR